jgi:hypothetical protein
MSDDARPVIRAKAGRVARHTVYSMSNGEVAVFHPTMREPVTVDEDEAGRRIVDYLAVVAERDRLATDLWRMKTAAELVLGDWANVKMRDRLREALSTLATDTTRKDGE